MADLDYAEVRGRLAITVGDTDIDPDVNPDVQWCDSGIVRFTPNLSSVHVIDPVEGVFTAGNAPIEATIGPDGRLTYGGLPFVMLLDLGSDKVNPVIPRNISSYKVDFLDIQSQGRSVTFASFSFHPLPNVVNDLTLLAPLPTGTGVAIVQGPQGEQGIQGIQGIQGEIGPIGPQGIQGIQGEQGIQGLTGEQGIQGIQGVKGDTGDIGPQGIQGVVGPVGPAGLEWRGVWASGTDYIADDAVYHDFQSWFASSDPPLGEVPSDTSTYWQVLAARGAQGIQGIQGVQGVVGPEGPQGIQGIQGVKGDTGDTGPQGEQGLPGTGSVDSVNGDVGPNVVLDAADVGAHPAGGVVTDAMLPVRLKNSELQLLDANFAVDNGWYWLAGGATNSPSASLWGHLRVLAYDANYIYQEWIAWENTTERWIRRRLPAGWTAWSRVRLDEWDLDDRYKNVGEAVSDGELPARLRNDSMGSSDLNLILTNGYYKTVPGALNVPEVLTGSDYWLVQTQMNTGSDGTQTAVLYFSNTLTTADTIRTWRRNRVNNGWGPWFRLRTTESELDARYVNMTGDETIAGIKAFSDPPVMSGSNITALNASNLGSGTVPDARLPARLRSHLGTAGGISGVSAADAVTESGWYEWGNSGANFGLTAGYGVALQVIGYDTQHAHQNAYSYNYNRSWTRQMTVGVWSAWAESTTYAGADARYVMLTGDQTISGMKTFSASSYVVNASGTSTYFGVGNTSTGVAGILLDGSNGDFIGSDYATITQENSLAMKISNYGGNIGLYPNLSSTPILLVSTVGIEADRAIIEKAAAASGTSGTVTLDAAAAGIYTLTPTGNVTTLTISNPPASGKVATIQLKVTQGATPYTIATPAGGIFYGAATPTQVANKKCIFTYVTTDGGASWDCSAAVQV